MNHYLKVIYNYIRIYVTGDEDIKDIVQESMLSIWMSLKNYGGESSFKTWAIGIVRRKIADHYRRSYKNFAVSISDYEAAFTSDDGSDSIAAKVDLNEAVKMLCDIDRELLYLAFSAELNYSEISAIMNIPVGTVKSRIFGIKKKLRTHLQEGG